MSIQPPPPAMQTVLGPAYKWLADTLKKLGSVQTQVNSTLQIAGLTISNNTPVGGQISWTACTVYYNGTAYPIAAGTSGTDGLVWWNVGDAVFSTGNSFTPSPTIFPVLTNTAGVADSTWLKVGANSIQASQVIGGLLPPGYQIQTPGQINVNANGTNTILSYTGAGALLTLSFPSGGGTGGPLIVTTGGTTLHITVDAQPTISIPLSGANNPNPDGMDAHFAAIAFNPNQSTPSNLVVAGFYISFKVSILIEVVVTGYVSGASQMTVGWAKKI